MSDLVRKYIVELEGFEPSSKRGINELSTCVVSSWFSSCRRPETTNDNLISLNFGACQER